MAKDFEMIGHVTSHVDADTGLGTLRGDLGEYRAPEIVWEEPTNHLRWNNGVLEQSWKLRKATTVDYEWRPIEDPSPSQTPYQHSDKE